MCKGKQGLENKRYSGLCKVCIFFVFFLFFTYLFY